MDPELAFEVTTPLGFSVRCTRDYWRFVVAEKHPVLGGREGELVEVLSDPRRG